MSACVRVRQAVLDQMLAEARDSPAQECCGLLAGRDGVITDIFPAQNVLRSATAYEIAPLELFRIFRVLRAARLEHLGIYHSHPAAPNEPSPEDVASAYYPQAFYFVLSPRADAPCPIRAFRIVDGLVAELAIEIS